MANTANIHILRSYANTSPTHLLDGQLAYSFVSNTLFIGSNTGVKIITDPSVRILAQAGYNQANAGTSLAQAAYNLANTESSQVFTQAAYNTANSAQANTVVTQGVDTTQNTSIQASFNVANSATSNTIYTQGVDVTQNTNISLLQGAMASANANILSLFAIDITQNTSITTIQGVDSAQNANITLLQTGLNTANANTVYTQGVDVTQNTNITSVTNNLASNVSYFQGIENTQNTWISSNSVYSQAAFALANSAGANTVFLTGALATANANTIVTQGVDVTQNTNIAILQAVNATQNSNIASVIANTIYTQGVDVTQNTSIQGAYNTANTGYTFVTSGGTVTGNTTINGNLNVVGNISFVGNVINTTISGNTGQFFGNTLTGFGALYAGVPTGYTIEPQTAFQVSTNYNGYAQVNHQNINSGNNASGDFVVTSDNGSTNDTFIDMGINSSHYNQPNGFALTGPNDGYLYVYGNTSTGGGQLILATMTQNDIVLATNGQNSPNEVMRVGANGVVAIKSTNTSISTSSGALVVSGGVGISGNVFTNGAIVVNNGFYSGNNYTGPYIDGIVTDYMPGNGRISVGPADGLTLYNGGVGNVALLSVASNGAIVTSNNVYVPVGQVLASNGSVTLPSLSVGVSNYGFFLQNGIQVAITANGSRQGYWGNGTFWADGNLGLLNSSGTIQFGSGDLVLARDAANILAQRNGTNTQTFRLYGTYTDASNYERLSVGWSGTNAVIQSENAGTGSLRNLYINGANLGFQTSGTTRFSLSNTAIYPNTDNAIDLGVASTNRFKNAYFSGVVTTNSDASINTVKVGLGGGSVITNIAIGAAALNATATGTNNIGIGYLALSGVTSGVRNVCLGNSAGQTLTTTNYNVFVGHGVGTTATGNNNTGLGGIALYNNQIGDNLTAIGYSALVNNTTASNLTAIGTQALQNNTTNVATLGSITGGSGYTNGTYTGVVMTLSSGSSAITYPTATIVVSGGAVTSVTLTSNGVGFKDTTTVLTAPAASIGGTGSGFTVPVATLQSGTSNTAVGYQAGYSNSVGSQATFVGYQAGYSNTTSTYNSAFGYQALYTNSTSQFNTACGNQALYLCVGSQNAVLGQAALYSSTSGSRLTAIGFQAGYGTGTNANTTGSNNTYLGYQTVGSANNNTNEMVIGYQAVGLGSNTTVIGNSSTTATYLYGSIVQNAPIATSAAAPTIASSATIAPTAAITFISGTTTINTITAPSPLSAAGGQITLIPTGLWSTGTSGNIALATTAVVGKALILFYDATTTKWYPSY